MHGYDNDDEGVEPGPEVYGLPRAEREYLVPSKDGQGRSVRVQCRLAPEHSRLVTEIHQSRKWPFRVQGDIFRFAIVSTLKRLAGAGGFGQSVIAQAEILKQLFVDEEYQLQWEENFRSMRRVIEKYMARGAPAKARELTTRALQIIRAMPTGYWRDQYEQEILKRYGHIIDGDPYTSQGQAPEAGAQTGQAPAASTPLLAPPRASAFDPDDHGDD